MVTEDADEFYDPLGGSGGEADKSAYIDPLANPGQPQAAPEMDDIDDPLLGKDGDDSNDWSPHNSFLADSPYFNAFVENDVKSLSVLVETLQDISARTKTFSKCGALMAESTRRLSYSCRLKRDNDLAEDMTEEEQLDREAKLGKERRKALGNEMADLLELLGEVLEEIATAQMNMVNVFDSTLGMSLEAFAGTELMTVNMLKQEAEQNTEQSENMFFRYLNGKNAGGTLGLLGVDDSPSLSPDPKQKPSSSSTLSNKFKNWRNTRQENQAKKNDAKRMGDSSRTGGVAEDSSLAMATTAANLRLTLEQIRLGQATAELKRFQLLKHLVGIKHRRNFELCEGALASLHGMRTCFHQSHDIVQALGPRMVKIQTKENDMKIHHEKKIMPVWNERENALIKSIDKIHEGLADASFVSAAVASGDPALIDQQALALGKIEDQTSIWELPEVLAKTSRYRRDSPDGILVEGWLYKKSTARMSLQPWHRRWFMMNKDAIYYYRTSSEIRKNSSGEEKECMHTSQRVKVCDIVLCTIRELPDDGNNRFCFEVITPNQKPLALQARGPLEFRRWIDAIRANVENQLVYGDPHSDQLNKNIGKKNIIREKNNGAGSKESDLPPGLGDNSADGENDAGSRDLRDDAAGRPAHPSIDAGKKGPRNPLVSKIMEANPICADCSAKSPDWVSLNLGVLLCIQCSGIHRSLGVHVSKVRSLTLDSLSDGESQLLLSLGNEKANAIWEKGLALQKGWKKPDSKADRKTREGYIKSKYMWKGFLAYNESDGKTETERAKNFGTKLYEASKMCNVLGMSEAIAFGGSVDWVNSEDDNKSPLHACVQARKGDNGDWHAIECAELLLQHGAKMETSVESCPHILDFAKKEEAEMDMIDYIWTKLPETERKDRVGLQMYEAAKTSDIDGLAEALAQGATADWKNAKDGGKTPLHVCVLGKRPPGDAKWNAIECVELLLGRGGRLDALDNDGHNVMDCAVVGSAEREMIEFLATKLP